MTLTWIKRAGKVKGIAVGLMGLALAAGCRLGGGFAGGDMACETPPARLVTADQSLPGLLILDGSPGGDGRVLWRWEAKSDAAITPEDAERFHSIDECKPTAGGRTILVTASHGGVAEVDVATTSAVWYVVLDCGIAGPHSIAELPDGRFMVANSVGADRLELIEPVRDRTDGAQPRVTGVATLIGAHGVAWDERRQTLFALGYTNLVEYAYDSEGRSVRELRRWRYDEMLGDCRGHDLYPAGNGEFYLTNGHGVWRFNPDRGDFVAVRMVRNAKSFSRSATRGDLMVTPTENWWANRLLIAAPGDAIRPFARRDGARYYKARWIE